MTAPAAKPAWPIQRPRIPMRATYPASHELHGTIIERGRLCVCGERFFPQWVLTAEYIKAVGEQILEVCEVVTKASRRVAWYPKKCHKCLRRM